LGFEKAVLKRLQKPTASHPILAGYIINEVFSLFCRL
jgi:hypothetical protein